MAIQLSNLSVKEDGKSVREYITTPQGSIEVYEPSLEMVDKLLAIQKESGFDLTDDVVEFNEVTLLREVFPLLTNIQTGDISEEELQKIIDNPSIHLLIAQNIVAQIISEANKLYAERMKAEIASAETVLAQSDLINSIPSIMNEHAKRNPVVAERLRTIEELQTEVEKMIEDEDNKEVATQEPALKVVSPETVNDTQA